MSTPKPDRPDFASAVPCTSRCYPATRGGHSASCDANRANLAERLDAVLDTWLTQQHQYGDALAQQVRSLADTIRDEQPAPHTPAAHARLETTARFVDLVGPAPVAESLIR